jgi:acetyl-CoA carboxylase carboxyl transferase subunit alpha
MPAGLARIDGISVCSSASRRGRDVKRIFCVILEARIPGIPEGTSANRLGQKFKLPIVTLIDTPGAYPGISAEERRIDRREPSRDDGPEDSIVLWSSAREDREAHRVADRVLMLENAYYSVISPEGCAAIFETSQTRARAAEALKLNANNSSNSGS